MNDLSLLVVDDEAMARIFVRTVIEREKLPVVLWEADNGIDAVQLARQHQPDLILLDIRMPGLDGLQTARIILEENRQASIVIVSAYSDFEYARTAFRAGVSDYLLKPVRPQAIVELIERTAAARTGAAVARSADKTTLVSAVEQYVEANITSPIQLKHIAKGVFISPYHLSRTFKQQTGQSIVDYIQGIRLAKAESLLRETDLPITEIAGRVGFNNAAYFATCFKNILGITPLQFRKQQDIVKK